MVSNPVPRLLVRDEPCNRSTQLREPLAISLSSDGRVFDAVVAVVDTRAHPKRFCGSAKSFGPSYPQAREVPPGSSGAVEPGIWIGYSINKEDVGVSRVPHSALPARGATDPVGN